MELTKNISSFHSFFGGKQTKQMRIFAERLAFQEATCICNFP